MPWRYETKADNTCVVHGDKGGVQTGNCSGPNSDVGIWLVVPQVLVNWVILGIGYRKMWRKVTYSTPFMRLCWYFSRKPIGSGNPPGCLKYNMLETTKILHHEIARHMWTICLKPTNLSGSSVRKHNPMMHEWKKQVMLVPWPSRNRAITRMDHETPCDIHRAGNSQSLFPRYTLATDN